ncbi:hypothetical protein PMM47T1_20758 [Pseudomonas sp. M47T1]|uniref:hypothetical protein n=1 Tax=Pseudomonas sp. M47T1 TaxID=1179778 RepID=UPI00026072FE|nr:hypothetical protein [Pseudomonas sp. M47T1]EIK94561.1 hypothetical protein PMM47T1_20758 [Pseudomonas sp. M47T1]
MSIAMNLEIESGVSIEKLASIFRQIGQDGTIEGGLLTGNFSDSNAFFTFFCPPAAVDVSAEGLDVCWQAGLVGAIHCPVSFLVEAQADIAALLVALEKETAARFVLSFQYETIYAVRDEVGLVFHKSMLEA